MQWKYQHFHSCYALVKITDFFHRTRWNIFGIHLKKVNILYGPPREKSSFWLNILIIRVAVPFNPFKPSVFMGHQQLVKNQIRRRRTRRLIRFYIDCFQMALLTFECHWRLLPNNPLIRNGFVQLIRVVCLIWFFTSQSTIFQLRRNESSWVESVLS